MRILSVTALLLATLPVSAAIPASHYNMGPAMRFAPESGEEAFRITFSNGYAIDTRVGEPQLPAGLKLEGAAAAGQCHIVQFTGPVRQAWLRELHRLGIATFGYLPSYATLARLTPAQQDALGDLPFVRWTGLYQPAYKLEPGLTSAFGSIRLVLQLAPDANPEPTIQAVSDLGGTVDLVVTDGGAPTIELTADGRDIPALARLADVLWIQAWSAPELCNSNCQWVVQSGWRATAPPDTSLAARPVWANGVRGRGVILSTTDTGLNTGHDQFRDPALSITPPGVWPDHRKVVAFKLYQGASASESPYHGSHVTGTVGGDDSIVGGTSFHDGMARDARLYFVDLTSASGSFVIPTNFYSLWDTVYNGYGLPDSVRPIKQHSGSWGWSNSSGTYLIQDASTDAFGWAHPDFLNIMAAGNESSTRRIRNPGIAKNVLTVGATQNGTSSNAIASFSSRGPTQDGRLKPNVCAPGVDLYSARNTGTNTYTNMSGTSMATPAVNGTVGLMRCYLQEGYYPGGTPNPADRISYISAALLRAMAQVSADPNIGSYTPPDNNIGWGRINADSVLYFAGDTRRLLLADDTFGLATGEYKESFFRVQSAIPLRVCLAWTDTAAAPSANPTIVNNLDLELLSPSGVQFRGNRYTSGQSTPNPTTWDSINVEECCRVNSPDTGLWRIRVYARNVATARKQGFGWAITGDVYKLTVTDVGTAAVLAPVGLLDSGTVVAPKAIVQNYGDTPETFRVRFTIGTGYWDTTTVSLVAGAMDTVTFADWLAEPVGTFPVKCTTELATDMNPTNDALDDSVIVAPLTGIEEQSSLPRAFALENATPNPFRSRAAIRYALPRSTQVSLGIYSVSGALVRTLDSGTRAAGWYRVSWDGRDSRGNAVARGIYYCRLKASGFTAAEKLIKLD
uniref:T9SS type A sorting domain-containing protein n=1 Tax=candidate division WOR-3 bacterium TaxID=2052148 RepID=A0A7C4GAX3_UNCW3